MFQDKSWKPILFWGQKFKGQGDRKTLPAWVFALCECWILLFWFRFYRASAVHRCAKHDNDSAIPSLSRTVRLSRAGIVLIRLDRSSNNQLNGKYFERVQIRAKTFLSPTLLATLTILRPASFEFPDGAIL